MHRVLALSALMLIGCGDPGPTPSEVAAHEAEKNCSKLYAGLTKVLKDQLNKAGLKAELGEKPGFVEICVKADLSEEQVKCMDPNLGGTEDCKKALEPKKDQMKELQEYLLEPMKKAQEEAKKKAEEEAKKAPK